MEKMVIFPVFSTRKIQGKITCKLLINFSISHIIIAKAREYYGALYTAFYGYYSDADAGY